MRALLLSVVLVALLAGAALGASLSTDKSLYKIGDEIKVYFSDPGGHKGAWIGLFYADVPTDEWTNADSFDLAYVYTKGATEGVVTFTAKHTGFLQVRFFNEDAAHDVPVASSATFEVSTEGGRIGEPSLAFDKPVYKRGEKIKLSFTFDPTLPDGAWIGLFKNFAPLDGSDDPDRHDIKYDYIKKRTSGVWAFDAPNEPGYYVAAIISGAKNEWTPYCKVRMQVSLDGVRPLPVAHEEQPLALGAAKVRAGDEITVAYAAPLGLENPWIGVMPATVTTTSTGENDRYDISYTWVKSGMTWYWTFHAPSSPGQYVVRLFPSSKRESNAISDGVIFEVIPR